MFRKSFEEQFDINVTTEKIEEFVNTITQNLGSSYVVPSEESTKAAAAFLLELIQAGKYGDSWNSYKKRIGVRQIFGEKQKFKAEWETLDSPMYGVMFDLVLEKITTADAKDRLRQLGYHASDRTIERWIKALRPRAEQDLLFRARLSQTKGVTVYRSDPQNDDHDLVLEWAERWLRSKRSAKK